jgi:hypothetical protein
VEPLRETEAEHVDECESQEANERQTPAPSRGTEIALEALAHPVLEARAEG